MLYVNAMIIPVYPLFNYMINRSFYEEVCENKDKPEMECHGKCHLTEEMNKDKENSPAPNLEISLKDYPIASVRFIELEDINFSSTEQVSYPIKDYRFLLEFDIFHPPKLLI